MHVGEAGPDHALLQVGFRQFHGRFPRRQYTSNDAVGDDDIGSDEPLDNRRLITGDGSGRQSRIAQHEAAGIGR